MLQRAKANLTSSAMRGKWLMIFLAIIPLIAFYMIWLIFPMVYSFVMSFYNWNPLRREQEFLRLANYHEVFFKDLVFWEALKNTAYYALVTVPVGTVLALLVAIMINSLPKHIPFFRMTYFLPVVTSMVAVSIVWRWLYQPRFGFINALLGFVASSLGLQISEIRFLTNPRLAMLSVMAMSMWKGIGYTIILFMAGLDAIPRTYYEAAQIDGASRWPIFRHIMLPLLRPTMVFILVTGLIGAFQVFTQMYVMTQGGPINATRTIVYLLYDKAFQVYRFGYASALAFILFAIVLVLSVVQLRLLRIGWEY